MRHDCGRFRVKIRQFSILPCITHGVAKACGLSKRPGRCRAITEAFLGHGEEEPLKAWGAIRGSNGSFQDRGRIIEQTEAVRGRSREKLLLSHARSEGSRPTDQPQGLLRVFLAFVLPSLGSVIGTWVGGYEIVSNLF